MSKNSKRIVIPTVIIIITLVVLIMGAAYAYFSNGILLDGTITSVDTTAESVGVATLSSGKNLILELTPKDMMQTSETINYYATLDGTPTTEENSEIIATASVAGNGVMNCQYKLYASITATNNMYTAFKNMSSKSTNKLILTVDGVKYDFFDVSFPMTISGTIEGIKEGTSKDIYASFMLANRSEIDQTALKATDLKINFSVNEFKCNIVG